MYIDVERETENDIDIHNEACLEIRLMLRLLLVKDKQYSDIHVQKNNDSFPHGTAIIKYLTLP